MLGIRAYDTRDDVKKNNQRLLDYVRNGGTLLVQYNTSPSDFNDGHYTPYPAQLSRERVTVEQAPVTILDPQNPVFHYPNPDHASTISMAGCRSAACTSWTSGTRTTRRCWRPTIPASRRRRVVCCVAQYGKGYYIYTGYAFFRQLPFGVPGAIRLYVNLLSVGHEPK